jgi:hypothetical protein
VVKIPSQNGTLKETAGAVFLLPTVEEHEVSHRIASIHTSRVPSGKKYLRWVSLKENGFVQDDEDTTVSSTDGDSHDFVVKTSNSGIPRTKTTKQKKKGFSKWFSAFV